MPQPGAAGGVWSRLRRGGPALALLLISRWFGTSAQFLLNVVLGRALGPEGLGIYYLFQAWYRWLAQLGGLGLPNHSLRSLSVLEGTGDRAGARRFLGLALGLVGLAGLAIGAVAVPFRTRLAGVLLDSTALAYVLTAAVLAGPLWVGLRIVGAGFKSRRRAQAGLLFEFSALPLGLLLVLGGGWGLGMAWQPLALLWATVGVLVLACGTGALMLLRSRPARAGAHPVRSFREFFPRRSIAPLWGVGIINTAINNVPLMLMPHFATTAEIALFGVSTRLVALAASILDALASEFLPRFARCYDAGDADGLRAAYRRAQWLALATYAPILAVFLTLPKLVLGVFGPEFQEGVSFLYIVALGQAVNSASGLVGGFLSMTHRQSLQLRINGASLVVLVGGIAALGSAYGAIGVAWAYSLALVLSNGIGFLFVRATIAELRARPPAR